MPYASQMHGFVVNEDVIRKAKDEAAYFLSLSFEGYVKLLGIHKLSVLLGLLTFTIRQFESILSVSYNVELDMTRYELYTYASLVHVRLDGICALKENYPNHYMYSKRFGPHFFGVPFGL